MITLKEILKSGNFNDLPKTHQDNLMTLIERINKIRSAYGKPMFVTSGYRSMADHLRIYQELATKRGEIFIEAKVPMKSKHLNGAAVDIADKDGKLFEWTKANETLLEQIGLWCEEKDDQKRVHYQIYPPASGKRFFKP